MTFSQTITGLANVIGYSLYYIFKFFESFMSGYAAILLVLSVFFIIVIIFYFIRKEMLASG